MEQAFALKSVIESLFGNQAWLEIKHATGLKTWKKYSAKILSAIELSAKATVKITDAEWFSELEALIEHGKRSIKIAKDTEQIFSILAATLTRISFFQLGRMPCNGSSNKVTLRHQGNWRLSQYRSVQYVQSIEQAQAKAAHNKTLKKDAQKLRAS